MSIKNCIIDKTKSYLIKKEQKQYMRWLSGYISDSDKLTKNQADNIKKYWKELGGDISAEWHRFYQSRSGIEDRRFIDDSLFYSRMFPLLNRQELQKAYADKNNYDVLFADIPRPRTIVRNINGYFYTDDGRLLTESQAIYMCADEETFIIKPTLDSCGGRGIEIINNQRLGSDSLDKMVKAIKNSFDAHKKDYIVQEVIEQSNELRKLNKTTLNTMRVSSVFFKGEPYICNPFFRVGSDKVNIVGVDSDVFYYGLTSDGKLNGNNFDYKYRRISKDVDGCQDFQVPNYQSALELVKEVHKHCPPYIQFIGADIAFDKKGFPILLEINTRKPFIIAPQCTCGPLFGEMTEEIAKELLIKRKDELKNNITIEANGVWW